MVHVRVTPGMRHGCCCSYKSSTWTRLQASVMNTVNGHRCCSVAAPPPLPDPSGHMPYSPQRHFVPHTHRHTQAHTSPHPHVPTLTMSMGRVVLLTMARATLARMAPPPPAAPHPPPLLQLGTAPDRPAPPPPPAADGASGVACTSTCVPGPQRNMQCGVSALIGP